MKPEKPWTRALGPLGWVLVIIAMVPAITATVVFLLQKGPFSNPTEPSTQDSGVSDESPAPPPGPSAGTFAYITFDFGDSARSGKATLRAVEFPNGGKEISNSQTLRTVAQPGTTQRFVISPDGTQLAYMTEDSIRVSRLDGSNEMEVVRFSSYAPPFIWTEDSQFLAFQTISLVNERDPGSATVSTISFYNPADETTVTTTLELGLTHELLGATDERIFVKREQFGGIAPQDQIWGYYELNGREINPEFHPLRIFPDNHIDSLVSPDGQSLFYSFANTQPDGRLGAPYEIHKIDVATTEDVQIYVTDSQLYALVPSNGQIIFGAFDGVFEMDPVPGGEVRQLLTRDAFLTDDNANRYVLPIAKSPGGELLAASVVGTETEVDGERIVERKIDSIVFLPVDVDLAEILLLPEDGVLPLDPDGQFGWQWIAP